MVSEVNISARNASGAQPSADPRLYLRDGELDRGVGLILAGERALSLAIRDAGVENGLSAGETQVLLAIYFQPGRDVSTLRDALGVTVPTFARLLGRLDGRGLVARDRSGQDGRRRVLSLSPLGSTLVAPLVDRLRDRLRQAYRAAGPEAVSGTRAVLEALAAGVQDGAEDGLQTGLQDGARAGEDAGG